MVSREGFVRLILEAEFELWTVLVVLMVVVVVLVVLVVLIVGFVVVGFAAVGLDPGLVLLVGLAAGLLALVV